MAGLQSMTGFGKASGEVGDRRIAIEIRSLNSKQFDSYLKMPSVFREKEIELRKLLGEWLFRGKVDVSIYLEEQSDKKVAIQHDLAEAYYHDLKKLAKRIGEDDSSSFLGLVMNMPDVLQSKREELSDEEWEQLQALMKEATDSLIGFRKDEGAQLEEDIRERVKSIDSLRDSATEFFGERIENVKERIRKNLREMSGEVESDPNRFEQELVYYIEKLDLNEENVRLENHCSYFLDTINNEDRQGRKLGFIAQEMGREINTMGAKANHPQIQKLVVRMKDDLEKIKEQILNVL